MMYIVDAQLPRRLKTWLEAYGVEAMHTLDLPDQNDTQDIDIIHLSVAEDLIVVTKDSDFIQYRIIKGIPNRILMISTGNIVNNALMKLFEENFPTIHQHFLDGHKVVEIDNDSITLHE